MALTAKKVYAILKRQISDMEAKLNSPLRYRGTVATADLLPLNPDIGDMYNIESKSVYGEAGMNVAWNGVVWDTMGAPIDMSLYFTKEEADTTIQNMVNEYFENNPVKPGATTEQAQQIEQNKKDVTSLKEDISNKITKFYASSQGENHLADSDNGKIQDMMLYGKSEQKQYNGCQLIDFSKGIYIRNATGSILNDAITVTGKNSYSGIQFPISLKKVMGNKIILTIKKFSQSNSKAPVNIRIVVSTVNRKEYIELSKAYDVSDNVTDIVAEVIVNNNNTGLDISNTVTVEGLQLQIGSEQLGWEPYTGGIPSPNPDYPQEIKSVVNPTVKVCGKNLAGLWKQGLLSTDDEKKIIANNYWVNTKEYVKISVNNYAFSSDSTCRALIYEYDRDKKYIGAMQLLTGVKSTIYVPNSKCAYIKFGYNYDGSKEAITPDEMGAKHWLQLELGSTATPYEPYHEQTVTLPYTLNAIPVSSDGNVTIDVQQYVSDYFDVERGKLVRMVADNRLLSAYNWNTANEYYWGSVSATTNGKAPITADNSKKMCACNYLFASSTYDVMAKKSGIAINNIKQVVIGLNDFASVDEFKTFLTNNDVRLVYPLEVPEEIDLTPGEIQALKALATYYPTTNISVNSEQLDGYTVFNYPISMENGWNYVKQQIGDTRDYIYDMDARTQDTDLQAAEAYVNSEYAVALTELEV